MNLENPVDLVLLDENSKPLKKIDSLLLEELRKLTEISRDKVILHCQKTEEQKKTKDGRFTLQRRTLLHLFDIHTSGYVPFSELVFLRDRELQGLKYLPTAHANFKFSEEQRTPYDILDDSDIIGIAVQHEVLPKLSTYLLGECSQSDLESSIESCVSNYAKLLNNVYNINPDKAKNFVMGVLLYKSVGFAKTDSQEEQKYQFGSRNQDEVINALHLFEESIDHLISDHLGIPSGPDSQLVKFRKWKGYEEKLQLYLESTNLISSFRELVSKQHDMIYSDNALLEGLGNQSNSQHTLEKFLMWQDSQVKSH